MMIQINDTIISSEVIDEFFLCDLSFCKGICCVEGDAGAPVEEDEIERLESILPIVWDDLSSEAQIIIQQQGVTCIDSDGEYVTSTVNGKDCVFTCYDEKNNCRCAIEKACREGRTTFPKPVSCHLYPVRITDYKGFRAVNYHQWSVCQTARQLGKKEGIKVYRFLEEPLIREFGEEWYENLCRAAEELESPRRKRKRSK
jgi:hypothetical protein